MTLSVIGVSERHNDKSTWDYESCVPVSEQLESLVRESVMSICG